MTPKEIKSMLRGFSYTKSLGQNFIFDAGILNSIADASSVGSSDSVLEIGPGAGTLTNVLCRRANKVLCIEKDARLEPVLSRTLSEYTNVEVIFDDFLSVNLKAIICDKLCEPFRVVANLPYYITTPILFKFFESDTDWSGITVMVQKEVAQRLCASPGTKDCGAITIITQYYANPRIVLRVPRGIFTPPPDVDSVVVHLERHKKPPVDAEPRLLFRIIHAAYAMRRKTLLNNLSAGLNIDKQACAQALISAGVTPEQRGETLSLKEFSDITKAILPLVLR